MTLEVAWSLQTPCHWTLTGAFEKKKEEKATNKQTQNAQTKPKEPRTCQRLRLQSLAPTFGTFCNCAQTHDPG
jgi:hypothetical protein